MQNTYEIETVSINKENQIAITQSLEDIFRKERLKPLKRRRHHRKSRTEERAWVSRPLMKVLNDDDDDDLWIENNGA